MNGVAWAGPVTVFGGNGYVGRRLVEYLRGCGCDCWIPERADPSLFKRPLGTVFYCIGLTADFRSRPFDTVQAHVCVLREVLQYGQFDQLIYLSSTRVYLGADDTYEDQSLTVNPSELDDLYKLSKLMGESLVLRSGLACKVVRLSNVVGGAHGNPDSFVGGLWRDARSGSILLQSDPQSSKDYIHINDVVNLLALVAWHGNHRIYNLASGTQTTHAQWLECICAATSSTWSVKADAPLQQFLPIRVARLQTEFGYSSDRLRSIFC